MATTPTCHPGKRYGARGKCINCYNKWLRSVNPKYNERCIAVSAKARNTPQGIASRDSSLLKQRYGISLEDREKMKVEQDFKCKLCKQRKPLIVEHNHTTGFVRGLTCQKCNNIIAVLENNRANLETIFNYLDAEFNPPNKE